MATMSAKRHLRELQWRMMLVAVFFVIGACMAYSYQSTLIPLLLDPLHGQKLVYLNPAGGFSFIFLISIYAGIALSFPVLVQQLYSFLRPALPKNAQKKSPTIIISSFLLLLTGIAFGYFIAVPNALTFLYGFADQYVEASLTAESYLNFMIAYTIGIGMVFQVPLLLLLLHAIKPLTPGGLLKSEKWIVLLAFIVAAIITPTPDPINQAIIAGPVIVIYQIGVIAVLLAIARDKKQRKTTASVKAVPLSSAGAKAAVTPVTPLSPSGPHLAPQPMTAATIAAAAPLAAAPTQQALPATPRPTMKSVDGFTNVPRSVIPRLHVPQRPAQPLKTPPRPIETIEAPQKTTPTRGFYVDGIIAPRNVAA